MAFLKANAHHVLQILRRGFFHGVRSSGCLRDSSKCCDELRRQSCDDGLEDTVNGGSRQGFLLSWRPHSTHLIWNGPYWFRHSTAQSSSHTIVEARPLVYQRLLSAVWGDINHVEIVFGWWRDVLSQLEIYENESFPAKDAFFGFPAKLSADTLTDERRLSVQLKWWILRHGLIAYTIKNALKLLAIAHFGLASDN